MNKKILVLGTCVAALLAGCGSIPQAIAQDNDAQAPTVTALSEINAKLDNAVAIATAGGDQAGAKCWGSVKAWVNTLPLPQAAPALPAATGVSGELETARIKTAAVKAKVAVLKTTLAAGVPDQVAQDCAIVVLDAETIGSKILGAIGLSLK